MGAGIQGIGHAGELQLSPPVGNPIHLEPVSYTHLDVYKRQVKTRLGLEDDAEYERILELYCSLPLVEITVHPRVQKLSLIHI